MASMKNLLRNVGCITILLLGILAGHEAIAGDWPMWRGDAQRSGSTAADLPDDLQLHWQLDLGATERAWEDTVNRDRMPFDRCHEPIVIGHSLIVGSAEKGTIIAYDTRTGDRLWTFFTQGPIRLPPAGRQDRVFAASDDGYLYALRVADGQLLWKIRGGPGSQQVLGNGHISSAWPARGGPVVSPEGIVFFAAGIWPFMGVFIHAVDGATGEIVWTNDATGSLYLSQPHGGADSFGGVAPQGAIALSSRKLIVPSGRSVPAVLDATTGKLLYYHLDGSRYHNVFGGPNRKVEGGSQVFVNQHLFLNHRGIATTAYDLATGNAFYMWQSTVYPLVSDSEIILTGENITAVAADRFNEVEYEASVRNRKTGEVTKVTRKRWEPIPLWSSDVDCRDALIRAGNRLYGASRNTIRAIACDQPSHPLARETTVKGTVARLLAADDRLFAVTLEGTIYAFGSGASPRPGAVATSVSEVDSELQPGPKALAERLSVTIPVKHGWAFVHGAHSPDIAEALARTTQLNILLTTPSEDIANTLRIRFTDCGLYGNRITVFCGTPESLHLPPYIAAVTVVEGAEIPHQEELKTIVKSMRPYGGIAVFPGLTSSDALSEFAHSFEDGTLTMTSVQNQDIWLTREGALPGSANWTHLYGDPANSVKSNDARVRAPLGLLWYGGNSHEDVLPRHAHGPSEQVLDGRLFIQGINMLSARDVYTGMVLWRRTFDDLKQFDVYYDASYKANPLDTTYNQLHIPGANIRGTNYVVTPDAIYLVQGPECLVLDPATGKDLRKLTIPPAEPDGQALEWAFIAVEGKTILAGANFSKFSTSLKLEEGKWKAHDVAASQELIAMGTESGNVLWRRKAHCGFLHNGIAIGAGKVFCLDRLPKSVRDALRRRGGNLTEFQETITALDLKTGSPVWQRQDAFGTWLSYSQDHDVVVQCGRHSRDMVSGEIQNRMAVLRAADGSTVWDRPIQHGGPVMLHGDRVYFNAVSTKGSGIELMTGDPLLTKHPISQTPIPWTYHRRYGCNSVIASENLLTFRSGAAGFLDLNSDSGTGNFGGFKSGCTSNLIAANGVLNAPDYTRTCTCSYQNQASLGLIHWPKLDVWTANELPRITAPVARLGLNFGAPGDRRAENGTLWFDVPSRGGPSPPIDVEMTPAPSRIRCRHSSTFSGDMPWVAASSIEGVHSIRVPLRPTDEGHEIITSSITQMNDDAEEANGKVNLTSSDLELTQEVAPQTIALYFRNVTIPTGAIIHSASVQFTVDETTDTPTELTIQAELSPAPKLFAAQTGNLTVRKRTQASVTWKPEPWSQTGQADPAQRTPDLAPILREVVAQPEWESGAPIVLIITGTGKRVATACNAQGQRGATLEIHTERKIDPIPAPHTVTLVFAEPDPTCKNRQFDISIQGKTVLQSFSPLKATGKPRCGIRKIFPGISAFEAITIELKAPENSPPPILSGLEILRE